MTAKRTRLPITFLLLMGLIGFLLMMGALTFLSTNAPAGTPSYYMSCTPGNYYVGKQVYHWECR